MKASIVRFVELRSEGGIENWQLAGEILAALSAEDRAEALWEWDREALRQTARAVRPGDVFSGF